MQPTTSSNTSKGPSEKASCYLKFKISQSMPSLMQIRALAQTPIVQSQDSVFSLETPLFLGNQRSNKQQQDCLQKLNIGLQPSLHVKSYNFATFLMNYKLKLHLQPSCFVTIKPPSTLQIIPYSMKKPNTSNQITILFEIE